jgi:DNA-binding transcriptional MocR family regulator
VTAHYQIDGATAAEICDSVERGVRTGQLPAGAALPPVRGLADVLRVSPGTVAKAYQTLRRRGLVETAGRNGTRVRARPPVQSRLAGALPTPPGVVDVSSGEPDRRLLPDLGPCLRRLAAQTTVPVSYREAGPVPALLDLARERLTADGVSLDDAALTVTGGALDGIERLLTTHLRSGDKIAVEDPGWANLLDLVAAVGLEPIPVPVDGDGPTAAGLLRALEAGAAAVVVTARAHNPTGASVGAHRAGELRRVLAGFQGVLLIEDDHAAELSPVPLHPLAGAVPAWAFLRSVSKPFGPDLRLAVLAGDEASVARVEGRLRMGAGWVSTLLQRLVAELWRDPAVTEVVARAREDYAARRGALVDALAARGLPVTGRTGINVWVPVPDETRAVTALRDRGYAVAPGSLFRLSSRPAIRITVSPLGVDDIAPLADAVAAATDASDRLFTV